MTYALSVEPLRDVLTELEPICHQHYDEMQSRMQGLGVPIAEFNPQWDAYCNYESAGLFRAFIARCAGKIIGYSFIYATPDMHNGELIASEDTIYVVPAHRGKSAGRELVEFVHATLKDIGVKRLSITTSTDLKVAAWLEKRGYKHTAHHMTICF